MVKKENQTENRLKKNNSTQTVLDYNIYKHSNESSNIIQPPTPIM